MLASFLRGGTLEEFECLVLYLLACQVSYRSGLGSLLLCSWQGLCCCVRVKVFVLASV